MSKLPVLFVSHGAPTYALDPGLAGDQLARLGRRLPRPAAVLVISPHWMTRGVRVATTDRPKTIHDFGGFSPKLYDIQYPASGHPALAQCAIDLLAAGGWSVQADTHWGLDHGAWVPLLHMLPKADVPVFQVSMPHELDEAGALRLGRSLAPLSDEGVLIVGSGSLTHNLFEFRHDDVPDQAYTLEFVHWVRRAVLSGDADQLARALIEAPHGARAHPTSEHYLPLLIAAGAADAPHVAVLDGGVRHGVLSMESYCFEPGRGDVAEWLAV